MHAELLVRTHLKCSYGLAFAIFARDWTRCDLEYTVTPMVFHHVGCFLADHEDRCVRVARHNLRHYGCIDDAQIFDADDLQLWIDHRFWVTFWAHFTGARLQRKQ